MAEEVMIKLDLEARDVILLLEYCNSNAERDKEILRQNIPDYVREQRLQTMSDAERINGILLETIAKAMLARKNGNETMYERIKRMTPEEMREFIYWVYICGNKDGQENLEDSSGECSYFGGYMLTLKAKDVMPNDSIEDLWDNLEKAWEV